MSWVATVEKQIPARVRDDISPECGERTLHKQKRKAGLLKEAATREIMRVREYAEGDLEALRQIHARQGFDYPFPDLGDPLFVSKLVLTESDGEEPEASGGKGIVGAALLRVTAEAYLLLDPHEGTARERWNWLLALHGASERDAWRRGLEDVHAWLPPQIAEKFGRRLAQLGWIRDDRFIPYCKRLKKR
jgi:hypothetical protein